jgi:ankyrin repeat protein
MISLQSNYKISRIIIAILLFLGLVSIISINTTKNNQYKKLIQKAVLANNICATKFLIKNSVNINAKYKYNHTLLHSAALYGDIVMVKLLVKSGAKLSKNDFGLTAIDSAKDNNNTGVAKFLVGYYDYLGRIK